MGGTIKIDDSRRWMVAGWVYDNVVERLASIVEPADGELAEKLRKELLSVSVGYCDLRDYSFHDRHLLAKATSELYRKTQAEGLAAFGDPEFFPAFLRAIDRLRQNLTDAVGDQSSGSH